RAFVKRQQRQRERGLAQHVGRGQDGRDDEGDHNEIAALVAQLLRGDDSDPPQQGQDHRKLECDAERENQGHHQRQIFADLGQQLDLRGVFAGGLLHAERKPHQHRQHHEIDQHRAEHEEKRRRDQIGQESAALVLVKAGRHELVDLRRHDRKRDEARAEQRQLQMGDEQFQQRGVDELGIIRARDPDIGPHQHVVDLLGEEEAKDEGNAEAEQSLDQPRAQLDQVIHQGRLAGLDIFGAHDALASLATSAFTAPAGSTSAWTSTWTSVRGVIASGSPGAACASASTDVSGAGRTGVGVTGSMVATVASLEGSASPNPEVVGASMGLSTSSRRSEVVTSFCSDVMILPLARPDAASRTSSKLFLRSAISASRMASWNWPWNSEAILRALPIHCPTMRSTPGSSFGPMTISATTAMTAISLHPISNMKNPAHAKRSPADDLWQWLRRKSRPGRKLAGASLS